MRSSKKLESKDSNEIAIDVSGDKMVPLRPLPIFKSKGSLRDQSKPLQDSLKSVQLVKIEEEEKKDY